VIYRRVSQIRDTNKDILNMARRPKPKPKPIPPVDPTPPTEIGGTSLIAQQIENQQQLKIKHLHQK
jgi:hypothetical protein